MTGSIEGARVRSCSPPSLTGTSNRRAEASPVAAARGRCDGLVGKHVLGVAVGDLKGDGKADIVVALRRWLFRWDLWPWEDFQNGFIERGPYCGTLIDTRRKW
jgi:hypothetical protein